MGEALAKAESQFARGESISSGEMRTHFSLQ